MTLGTEFHLIEPARWKFVPAVRHVFAAKHPKCEHLGRGQIRFEIRMKIRSDRLAADIPVPLLHPIIHENCPFVFWHTSIVTTLASCAALFNPRETP